MLRLIHVEACLIYTLPPILRTLIERSISDKLFPQYQVAHLSAVQEKATILIQIKSVDRIRNQNKTAKPEELYTLLIRKIISIFFIWQRKFDIPKLAEMLVSLFPHGLRCQITLFII
jgi:hypothetical protein